MWSLFNQYIGQGVDTIVQVGDHALRPAMCLIFLGAIMARILLYFTVKAEAAFASEFEKRVHKHLADPQYEPNVSSFHELTKKILWRTHDEYYNLKRKYRRRRFDQISSLAERAFLIVEGSKRLVTDTLSQTRYLRKEGQTPRFVDVSKFVFESNPVFNRLMAILPMGMCNDILNILPGLFVVCGIFGTFLGVMGALPALSLLDPSDSAGTKTIMDGFLFKMAFAMGSSIVGILFSVTIQVLNSMLNPEAIYYSMVNKFSSSLEFLWNDASDNKVAEVAAQTSNVPADRRALSFSNQKKAPEEPRVHLKELKVS